MAFVTKTRVTAYDNAGFSEMYLYDPAARTIKCVSCRPDGAPPTSDVIGARNGLFMSFDGRTFWTTKDGLVPRDANQKVDVYEFVRGRPQLITTGTADDTGNEFQVPGLAGVSGDGIDVYFATYATLVPQDENGDVLEVLRRPYQRGHRHRAGETPVPGGRRVPWRRTLDSGDSGDRNLRTSRQRRQLRRPGEEEGEEAEEEGLRKEEGQAP